MLFYTLLDFNGEKKPFVLTARVMGDNGNQFYTFKNMLNDRSVYPILKYKGDLIQYDGVASFDKILVVCNPENRATCVNFTPVFNILSKKIGSNLSQAVFESLVGKLTAKGNPYQLTARDIEVFFNAMGELEEYKSGRLEIQYDISKEGLINNNITVPILESSKKDVLELSFVKDGNNENVFMENPDSDVFIKLSTYEDILINDSACYTALAKVFIPFRNNLLYTPNYKSAISDNFDLKTLYGNADNNDLDIQPNEMYFYNAMKELINYGIQQEFPNNTLEECIENKSSSKRVRVYLEELASRITAINWGFTGNYPISKYASMNFEAIGDGDDEDDDLDIDEENNDDADTLDDKNNVAEGTKKYFPRTVSDSVPGLDYVLSEIIEQASLNDIYAPAEAVIKALRWGNRKPTRLKLSGLKGYFDFRTGKVMQLSGSFVGLEVKKINGATYTPSKIIKSPAKIKDARYARSLNYNSQTLNIPVGIVCTKEFMNGLQQSTCFTIPTLIKYIKENPGDVAGISFNQDKIVRNPLLDSLEVVPLEVTNNLINLSYSGEVICFNSDEFIDNYLTLGLYSENNTELSILEEYLELNDINVVLDERAYDNPMELANKYLSSQGLDTSSIDPKSIRNILKGNAGVKPYINAKYAKEILPIVVGVASQVLDLRRQGLRADISEIINIYLSEMLNHNAMKPEEILDTADMKTLNAFDSSETDEQREEREREEMRDYLIKEIPTGAQLVKLASKKYDAVMGPNNVIKKPAVESQNVGYVYIGTSETGKYYILSDKLPNGCKETGQRIILEQVLKVCVADSFNLLAGNKQQVKIYFASKSAWEHLADAFIKYVR